MNGDKATIDSHRNADHRLGDVQAGASEVLSNYELKAYRTDKRINMRLAPAPKDRDWMTGSRGGFANRCLPMRIANQAGWVILNDQLVWAIWRGGNAPEHVIVRHDGDQPHSAISHFGEGILTFRIPFLLKTPPGISILFRGVPNSPKEAIAPLEAVVETDWAVGSVSMNWKFTRKNTWVKFAVNEPICMVVPLQLDLLECIEPRIADLSLDPASESKYREWCQSVRAFNERLQNREPEATKLGWQRYYFSGTAPHAKFAPLPEASGHRVRLNLRDFTCSSHTETDADPGQAEI